MSLVFRTFWVETPIVGPGVRGLGLNCYMEEEADGLSESGQTERWLAGPLAGKDAQQALGQRNANWPTSQIPPARGGTNPVPFRVFFSADRVFHPHRGKHSAPGRV